MQIKILVFILIIFCVRTGTVYPEHPESWKFFVCLSTEAGANQEKWTATARYTKAIGSEYTALNSNAKDNANFADPAFSGLKFYFMEVWKRWRGYATRNNAPTITTTGSPTASTLAFYNENLAWKNGTPSAWHDRYATGWWDNATTYVPHFNFQNNVIRQRLIDNMILEILELQTESGMTFAGYTVDVPKLQGDFQEWNGSSNSGSTLGSQTGWFYGAGTHSAIAHGTVTNDISNVQDAKAEFYKEFNVAMRAQVSADAKWILQPWWIYHDNWSSQDEWIYQIKDRSDKDELTPDMLWQESHTSEAFVDDTDNFGSGVNITRDRVGISCRNNTLNYVSVRKIAAKAATNHAWYSPYLEFGSGMTLENAPTWLKLAMNVPNWCNLSDLPNGTASTSWDGNTFLATHTARAGNAPFARIGTDTIQCYMWGSNRGRPFGQFRDHEMFAVVRGTDSTRTEMILTDPNRNVYDIQRVNEYFEPDGNDARADFVRHANGNYELVDGIIIGTTTDGGIGYRFKISNNAVQCKGAGRTTLQ